MSRDIISCQHRPVPLGCNCWFTLYCPLRPGHWWPTWRYSIYNSYLPLHDTAPISPYEAARKTGQLIRQICWYNPYINRNFKLGSLIFQLQWAVYHKTFYGSRTIEDSVLAIPTLQRLYIDLNIHLVIDMHIIDFIYNYFNQGQLYRR